MSTTQEIRKNFLTYFKEKGHLLVPSSPVIPHEDPTLLFTNAGMNQFKDIFLGKEKRDYTKAASSQKCIRAGGKHNDLENVGHTTRHLTFFEMLGNFSFGDYFKKEAIQFAFEVSTEVFGFPIEKLYPTVFETDEEAFELWTAYVPAEKITRFGEKENFWAMGEVGPCGPCSELLFDRGKAFGDYKHPSLDIHGERYLEFWNLVFMQFNKDDSKNLNLLPRPSIDTGAGLERVVSLKMGVDNVFETDILDGIIRQVARLTNVPYIKNDPSSAPFKVIADHLRTLSFAIADGAQPSNTDRGYVLRKILRRAVRYGRLLKFEKPFLAKVFPALKDLMSEAYPELIQSQARIEEILNLEEEAFLRTLQKGGTLLNQVIERSKTDEKKISGTDAFKLKDTYGLPLDEILLLAKDNDLKVDLVHYESLEQEAKERSKKASKTTSQVLEETDFTAFLEKTGKTSFVGYEATTGNSSLVGIYSEGAFQSSLGEGKEAIFFLKETPFYAEMGGQVGDTGSIYSSTSNFIVKDTKLLTQGLIGHIGYLEKGNFSLQEKVQTLVDKERRKKIGLYHTATHLLHYALEKVLGAHIKQTGSLVSFDRLRFDFSHHKPLSDTELKEIETLINLKIWEDTPVSIYSLSLTEAQKNKEIKQFFGEKYGSEVRVVDIDFSKELCGGIHAKNTSSLSLFTILKESGIAAGVRRIEALVQEEAFLFLKEMETTLEKASLSLKTPLPLFSEKLELLLNEKKELEKTIKGFKQEVLHQKAKEISLKKGLGKNELLLIEKGTFAKEDLKPLVDLIASFKKESVIILFSEDRETLTYVVRLGDNQKSFKASACLQILNTHLNGQGGGKDQFAQGFCKKGENFESLFKNALDELLLTL